jgi:hypothetical protein
MTRKEYTGARDNDLDHMRRVRDLKTFLRGTTYQIGRKVVSAASTPQNEFRSKEDLLKETDSVKSFNGTAMSNFVNPNRLQNL